MEDEIIQYNEDMGKVNVSEEFLNELKGRKYNEQLHCYGWSDGYRFKDIPYKEVEKYIKDKGLEEDVRPIDDKKLIVKDGVIVGIYRNNIAILPYMGYCYDIELENNGAGYKEREWYEYLICLPYDHKLW